MEYLRNFYGAMDDVINGGTETDRVLVHWDLRSDAASRTRAPGRPRHASFADERARGAVVALSAAARDGLPVPGLAARRRGGGSGARTLLVGVPADIEAMRAVRPGRAAAWRTRAARRAVAAAERRGAGDRLRPGRLVRGFSWKGMLDEADRG